MITIETFLDAFREHQRKLAAGEIPPPTYRPLIYRLLDARDGAITDANAELLEMLEDTIRHWVRRQETKIKTEQEGVFVDSFAEWKVEMFPWL